MFSCQPLLSLLFFSFALFLMFPTFLVYLYYLWLSFSSSFSPLLSIHPRFIKMSCTTTPYSALVLPRRTRAPSYTCATGYEDRPNRVWFDRERAHIENELRRRCPLHYFLSKYDLSALLATLKQGADPALRDAAGRTPLDLAVQVYNWLTPFFLSFCHFLLFFLVLLDSCCFSSSFL